MDRILVVDDHEAIRDVLTLFLQKAGFEVAAAGNGLEAIALLAQTQFDTIVSDIDMPGMNGMALLKRVRERDLDMPVILMTGQASIQSAAEAVSFGALRYFLKPIDLATIVDAVRYGVRLRKMAQLQREAAAHLGKGGVAPGDRAGLETQFSKALENVWMAYQPIVSCSKGAVYAYEALVRSNSEIMPGPAALLDAAERLGRLSDLSRMIRLSVATTASGASGTWPLFVNLHPEDLLDEMLFRPMPPFGDLAERVVLEITERATLDGIRDLSERVARLRDMGFRLAVDDLGAGYSGLSTLVHLHPEVVKLDMSLTRGIDTETTKQRLVRSMAELCRDMGILVVAEGVETVGERDMLVGLGCDLLQGYLFAKPSPPFIEPKWADCR